MLHEADAANRDRAWIMAIGRYKRLVKAHPDNTESQIAHISLGNIYLEKVGDAHQARRWFAQYRRRFPNGPLGQEALYGEIQSLKTLGATGEEAALIERFLSRFPKAVQTAKLQKRLSALKAPGDDSAH
jgi:outer membrane protein assembly factor BamD (BamD/ComL family)